jgi:hypothetical protein
MMSKKLLVSLAAIAATAAFAVLPATAGAVSHWYDNGSLVGATPVPVLTWGTLSNVGNKAAGEGTITCHNVIGGFIKNPEGGGLGEGMTQEFSSYECSGNIPCAPGHEQASPIQASLNANGVYPLTGWPSKIEEKEGIRVNNTGVEVELGCVEPPEFSKVIGATFVTSPTALQNPVGPAGPKKGTEAGKPGESCFAAGTGELEVKGSGGVAKGKTTGCLVTLGYKEQELIQIKSENLP